MFAFAYGGGLLCPLPSRHKPMTTQSQPCTGDTVHPTAFDAVKRQTRQRLTEHGECLSSGLDERLAHSWRRSLVAGVSPREAGRDVVHADATQRRIVAGAAPGHQRHWHRAGRVAGHQNSRCRALHRAQHFFDLHRRADLFGAGRVDGHSGAVRRTRRGGCWTSRYPC